MRGDRGWWQTLLYLSTLGIHVLGSQEVVVYVRLNAKVAVDWGASDAPYTVVLALSCIS